MSSGDANIRSTVFTNPEYVHPTNEVVHRGKDRDENEDEDDMAKGGLIACVALVAVLAIAALVVGLIALINPNLVADLYNNGGSASCNGGTGSSGGSLVVNVGGSADVSSSMSRTYNIHIGNDWVYHEHVGPSGRVEGFSVDYLNAVCSAGGLSCRIVVDRYSNCWANDYGGIGLFAGYYDGCFGWVQDYNRLDAFDFTDPYMTTPLAYFFVESGNSFDTSDLAGKTIGFRNGWSAGAQCVSRLSSIANNILSDDQMMIVDSTADLVALLTNGEVDAVFIDLASMSEYVEDGTVESVGQSYTCAAGGNGVMVKKNDAGAAFVAQFNDAFRKLRETGGFTQLCEDAVDKYGLSEPVPCV